RETKRESQQTQMGDGVRAIRAVTGKGMGCKLDPDQRLAMEFDEARITAFTGNGEFEGVAATDAGAAVTPTSGPDAAERHAIIQQLYARPTAMLAGDVQRPGVQAHGAPYPYAQSSGQADQRHVFEVEHDGISPPSPGCSLAPHNSSIHHRPIIARHIGARGPAAGRPVWGPEPDTVRSVRPAAGRGAAHGPGPGSAPGHPRPPGAARAAYPPGRCWPRRRHRHREHRV